MSTRDYVSQIIANATDEQLSLVLKFLGTIVEIDPDDIVTDADLTALSELEADILAQETVPHDEIDWLAEPTED